MNISHQVHILAFAMVTTYEDFFVVPVWFYRWLGNSAEPFGHPFDRPWKQVLFKKIFFGFLFYYFLIMSSTGYTVYSMIVETPSTKEMLESICCVFFCISGFLKEFCFYTKLKAMHNLAIELKNMFPKTPELQEKMKTAEYCKKLFNLFLSYALFSNGFIVLWNVTPMFNSTKDYIMYGGKFRRDLCYYIWYPWDHKDSSFFVYLLTYLCDIIGGICAGVTFANIDMILCAVLTQVIMNLDYISRTIEEYVPTGNFKVDSEFMFPFIKLHIKCLK